MIMKTAENAGGNDSKILSQLGQKRTATSQNNPQQLQWIMEKQN